MSDLKLYPLSTPDGQAIPLEIVRGYGLIRQDFTDTPVNNVTIPACDFLYCISDQDCVFALTTSVTAPANGVHNLGYYMIPANTVITIDHNAAVHFSVVGLGVPGTLWVHTVSKYKDTHKSVQFDHN